MLKKLVITDFSAVKHREQYHGGGKKEPIKNGDLVEKFRQDFKNLDVNFRLKILFYYIKNKTKSGIYKKESNKVIGDYFGVGKDMINDYIKKLKDKGYIEEMTEIDIQRMKKENTYYKLLREDYNND